MFLFKKVDTSETIEKIEVEQEKKENKLQVLHGIIFYLKLNFTIK